MRHRDDFANHREVLARIERHRHERQLDVEQLGALLIESGAVVFARVVPVLELHHDFDALLLAHGANAEQRVDVDQADAADFHVMPGNLMPAANQHVVAAARDVDHVVRHQAMPALDQVEHTFALPDPGASSEQEAHAKDVGERAVHGRARGESVVEKRLQPPVEFRRLEARANDGDALLSRQYQQFFRSLLAFRDDDAGELIRQNRFDRFAARLRIERSQVRDLGLAEDVNPVGAQEARRVAGEHKARARGLRGPDLPLEPHFRRQHLQLQRIAFAGEQVADFEPRRRRR